MANRGRLDFLWRSKEADALISTDGFWRNPENDDAAAD
jgi:hypothetical protein